MPVLELADVLGVKRQTFKLWAVTGRIPAFKVAKVWQSVPEDVVRDMTKPLSMWAKQESTSVVYSALRRRLVGKEPPPVEPATRPRVTRPSPGIATVVSADRPREVGSNLQSEDGELMTVVDARRLGAILLCPPSTANRMADRGEIPAFKIDGEWRFEVARVLDHLQTPQARSSPDVDLWDQPPRARAADRRKAARGSKPD